VIPEGYAIERLSFDHAGELAAAYSRNRAHLDGTDPQREASFYTENGQAAALAGQLAAIDSGHSAGWVLVRDRLVVGRVNLNNIVRGALRSASIGYWVDAGHLGRGLASGAVEFVCGQARGLGLHRVEAGTLVDNVASQAVLTRCGFEYYGTAPKFLFIAGHWQDHRLYQRILHDEPL
jgi:[ribosomal protein S5]-alanine N-acetyltransferase